MSRARPIDTEAAKHDAAISSARDRLVAAALADDDAELSAAKSAHAAAEAERVKHDETRERAARVRERAVCIEAAEILERAQDVADWQSRADAFRAMATDHDTRIAAIDAAAAARIR